jgi:hypothetical protein
MLKIAEKLDFEREATVKVRIENESAPVYTGKLRCFVGCGGKSWTKQPKIHAILGGI